MGGYLLKTANGDLFVTATNDTDGAGVMLHGDKNYAESHPTSHFDVIKLDPGDNTSVICEGPLKPAAPTAAPTESPTEPPWLQHDGEPKDSVIVALQCSNKNGKGETGAAACRQICADDSACDMVLFGSYLGGRCCTKGFRDGQSFDTVTWNPSKNYLK